MGTALGWLGSDLAPKLRSLHSLGWVVLGVGAAWAAYGYKTVIDPYVTYESNEVTATALLWAVLFPNIVASGIGLYRQIRIGHV